MPKKTLRKINQFILTLELIIIIGIAYLIFKFPLHKIFLSLTILLAFFLLSGATWGLNYKEDYIQKMDKVMFQFLVFGIIVLFVIFLITIYLTIW